MQQSLQISIVSREVGRIQGKIMGEEELERLLDRWREWSSGGSSGLGFKNRSIEHQLMIEGAITRLTGSNVTEDPECERLDAAISNMPARMHKAVKLKYLFGWTNKDASKAMKMPLPTYKILMVRCRSWLCGRLSE